MIRLEAPYPAVTVVTLLPNPKLSDVEARDATVSQFRSMNNTPYSYAKDTGVSKLTYAFVLTRLKSMELQRFADVMIGQKILMTNHKGEQWIVTIASNPLEFQQAGKGQGPTGREVDAVTVQFEGTQL